MKKTKEKKINERNFIQVKLENIKAILTEMGKGELVTYMTILSHRMEKHDNCFPSISTIAKECDAAEITIKKHIKELADNGYLIINSGYQGRNNQYWFPKEIGFVETEECKSAYRITRKRKPKES